MGMISNGRATLAPSLLAKQEREPALDNDGPPQVDSLSEILSGASHVRDGAHRLKEMVAGMTREPRAAINEIEQEIGLLKDLIAEREQMLIEAIDQHASLSKEAVHGMGVVRKALEQIRDAFNAAIRPTPILVHQAEATHPGSERA
jgi:hypothetical protein